MDAFDHEFFISFIDLLAPLAHKIPHFCRTVGPFSESIAPKPHENLCPMLFQLQNKQNSRVVREK